MVKRNQETISFSKEEKERINKVANISGETFAGYIRRQILIIVSEEESQL